MSDTAQTRPALGLASDPWLGAWSGEGSRVALPSSLLCLLEPPRGLVPGPGRVSGSRRKYLVGWGSVSETAACHAPSPRQGALTGVFVGVQGPAGSLSRGLHDAGAHRPGTPQHHSQGATAARHSELRAAGRAAQEAAGEQGGSWGLGQAWLLSATHAHARAVGRPRAAARPASVTRPLAVSWGGRRGWPHTSRHPPG